MKVSILTRRNTFFKRKKMLISPTSGETVNIKSPISNIYSIEIPSTGAAEAGENVYMRKSRTHLSPILEESQIELEDSESKTPAQQNQKFFLWEEERIIEQRKKFLVDVEI
jgi:hypothetical protein